ncbi:phage tail protein [Stenotrophomonas maltophilia]|uniref:phage tail protein n=1 Tax=Stenotrophomonas maltophilia TaxID=40324 RepID=UPI002E7A6AC3|nr:phage tail protein [Stenotrophomonas maltophilia]
MTDTFHWQATSQSSGSATASVRRAKFGDGYSQQVAEGINSVSRKYQVSFVASKAVIAEIVAFLDTHVGASFLWAGPWGTGLYYCDTYTDSHLGGLTYSVTATFEQTFQP